MKVIKVLCIIAMTMAISIILTLRIIIRESPENSQPLIRKIDSLNPESSTDEVATLILPKPKPTRRTSRFLAERTSPRAAEHCKKDYEICHAVDVGQNATCCNNKCIDLSTDAQNCGACTRKCVHTDSCCRGECVNLSSDERNCGGCDRRCLPGGNCFGGICDYA